jgi:hypothetical protein
VGTRGGVGRTVSPRNIGEVPQVVVEFSKDKLPFDARNRWVGERPIYVENIGKSPALDVQIQQVQTLFAIAEFPELPLLKPGERLPIRPEITDTSTVTPGVSEFEVLLQVQCSIDGWRGTAKPMRVAYRDAFGGDFATDFIAKYEPLGLCTATDFRFSPTVL